MATVSYRLPNTELVVSGMIRTTTDAVLAPATTTEKLTSCDVKLVTSAERGPDGEHILDIDGGWFSKYKLAVQQTTDGRLASVGAEITGELGSIAKSVATVAGYAGAAAIMLLGAAPPAAPREAQVLAQYGQDHPLEHEALTTLRAAREQVDAALRTALIQAASAPTAPSDVGRVQALASAISSRLAPLEAHFAVWQASKVTTTDRSFEFRVPLDAIPLDLTAMLGAPQGAWARGGSITPAGDPTDLRSLWEMYGVGVEAHWLDARPEDPPRSSRNVTVEANERAVLARRPEQLEVRVLKPDGAGVRVTARSTAWVADRFSPVESVPIPTALVRSRNVSLTFDDAGFPTGITEEEGSALAGALTALTGVAEGITAGLEGGTKMYTATQAAGRATMEAELARVKAQVDLRQQRLLDAGLQATAGDAVELQRLQQLQGILDAQTAISSTDPDLVAALASRSGSDLSWYEAPTPGAQGPQEIIVRFGDGPNGPGGAGPSTTAPTPPFPLDGGGTGTAAP